MIEPIPTPPLNRKALLGFLSSLLALLALCIGIVPIPFTALICFPPGVVFGVIALVLGLMAQGEIRVNAESGKTLAWMAVFAGGVTILAVVCMISAGVFFLPRIYAWLVQALHQPRP